MDRLYFVYKNEALNEADRLSGNTAFAVKDSNNHYSIYMPGSQTVSNVYRTLSDPRDYLNTGMGDYRMFTVVGVPTLWMPQLNAILAACQFSSEGWPRNVLTEMESHGFLNAVQKEDAINKRRSFANDFYNSPHSQTNGA